MINKRVDMVDSHMKLADLMEDSGKWTKRMNKMRPAEIENVVMNLRKSAANAREVSAIHGEVLSAQHGHAYRYNTYDIAVANLERFQAQRSMAVPPAPPRVRPTGPTRTWGPPL